MTENNCSLMHHGRNVKRLREIFGIKQDILAMGIGCSQQAISKIEGRKIIDDEMLIKISVELRISKKIIKDYNIDDVLRNLLNKLSEKGVSNDSHNLSDKTSELYERIIQEKDEKIKLLERLNKNSGYSE